VSYFSLLGLNDRFAAYWKTNSPKISVTKFLTVINSNNFPTKSIMQKHFQTIMNALLSYSWASDALRTRKCIVPRTDAANRVLAASGAAAPLVSHFQYMPPWDRQVLSLVGHWVSELLRWNTQTDRQKNARRGQHNRLMCIWKNSAPCQFLRIKCVSC